jgi:dUTP pyrophosphatase
MSAKQKPVIKIKRLHPEARLPTRRDGDIGWDLYALSITPLSPVLFKVSTGIALELPEGYWGQIENRSSMGKNGYDAHGGIVDNHYRGEIIVILARHGAEASGEIGPGSKIAQLIIRRQEDAGWIVEEADSLSDTVRGDRGFGSTGE